MRLDIRLQPLIRLLQHVNVLLAVVYNILDRRNMTRLRLSPHTTGERGFLCRELKKVLYVSQPIARQLEMMSGCEVKIHMWDIRKRRQFCIKDTSVDKLGIESLSKPGTPHVSRCKHFACSSNQ